MKLHFVIASTRFSGGRQVLLRHANELARRGHDVSLWVQERAPRIDWINLQVPVHACPSGSFAHLPPGDLCLFDRPRLAQPLWQARRGLPVHVCQGYEGTDVANRIGRVLKERGLLRGGWELWRLWRRARQIDHAYRLPTFKLVIHRHLAELIRHRYQQTAYFVPNGLPAGLFTPPPQRTFDGSVVMVVGSADTPCKRIGDALEAVLLLKQQRPGVRLVRVASHPIREAERTLGVTDEYHTMLPQTVMAELYRRADVLLTSSDTMEGFGLPMLEAMACGVPCVATNIPAFRTYAEPADYAHFVPVGRPERMAEAIGRLLDDGAERRRLSQRGPEVAAAYTLERSYDAMEAALAAIVTNG
jgi:glycosyltransferase involved in cell wall biosynthesis